VRVANGCARWWSLVITSLIVSIFCKHSVSNVVSFIGVHCRLLKVQFCCWPSLSTVEITTCYCW
jgi:hypothetical protein